MNTKKEWRSVNDLYFRQEESKNKPAGVDDGDSAPEKKEEPEVRLSNGVFLPGDEGFQFNKKCRVRVTFEYLKKTIRKRVIFRLFILYDNTEEDLAYKVEGFEENGYAEAEFLLDRGETFYRKQRDDPSATCRYKFRATHTLGEKEVESELLDMPVKKRSGTVVVQLDVNSEDPVFQNAQFRLFSTDAQQKYNKTLTVKDDKRGGENCLDLEFTDVDESLSYTLSVECEEEELSYAIFENTPYGDLSHA